MGKRIRGAHCDVSDGVWAILIMQHNIWKPVFAGSLPPQERPALRCESLLIPPNVRNRVTKCDARLSATRLVFC